VNFKVSEGIDQTDSARAAWNEELDAVSVQASQGVGIPLV
jgi:hypothetical protein